MDTSAKTRLQVAGRSAGDGMENCSINPEYKSKNWTSNQQKALLTNLHNKPFLPAPAKLKEPKFVPYEPYKAAVSPILPIPNWLEKKPATSKLVIDSQKVNSLASSIIELYSNLELKDGPPSDIFTQNPKCCAECSSQIKALEDKIKLLEKENKEINAQYQVQIEVNADLKKMLVASLGEDVQCKVQYMTEDKAHLGKEVLQLSEELDQKREEIEKFSVQCNVWESKFKASSLMVKELVQWKTSLSHKLNDSISALDSMLKEHDLLFEQLSTTHCTLDQILDAFDPSAKHASKNCDSAISVLQLAEELKSLSSDVQERLIGKTKFYSKKTLARMRQFTRAENLVNQLFTNFEKLYPIKDVTHVRDERLHAGLTACQILPHICEKDIHVTFCKHCSGEIKTI